MDRSLPALEQVIRICNGERGYDALTYDGEIDTRAEVELASAD